MRFQTLSGSHYEVNESKKLIRRLSGSRDPSKNQGADGDWKQYEVLHLELGKPAFIEWDMGPAPLWTQTNNVCSILRMDMELN
jgi:hypothetical protein